MKEPREPLPLWIACGVLRPELEALAAAGRLTGVRIYLDSMLHMSPPALEVQLGRVLQDRALPKDLATQILVYGDCCPGMQGLLEGHGARRVDAPNCAQMLLGRARFRELMRERAFLMLPEWTLRWETVFREELALGPENARLCMQGLITGLVYLDTGVMPVPHEELEACGRYLGLPYRVETVGLEELERALAAALAPEAGS